MYHFMLDRVLNGLRKMEGRRMCFFFVKKEKGWLLVDCFVLSCDEDAEKGRK